MEQRTDIATGEPPSTAAGTAGVRPSLVELLITLGLLAVGLLVSAAIHAYDTGSAISAVAATAIGSCLGWLACWSALRIAGASRGVRSVAALRIQLAWHLLMLGELAYIGFILLPFEVAAGAVLVKRRAGLSSWWASLAIACCGRATTLLVGHNLFASLRAVGLH